MHSASSSSCISLNGSSYTHAAIGGELLPACVDHRPRASNATAPAAAVISWLSRSSRTDIRRFIEYYILLGAERFAILDNLCNESVPEIYEKVRDDTGVELLSERIRLAYEARPRYGRCLGALFFGT